MRRLANFPLPSDNLNNVQAVNSLHIAFSTDHIRPLGQRAGIFSRINPASRGVDLRHKTSGVAVRAADLQHCNTRR